MVVTVRTLEDFIAEAARQLKGDGWKIARCQGGRDAVWHLAARKAARWRVVQVLVPATVPTSRLQDKVRLGQAAQLSAKAGSMEQWLAHVSPRGHITFGRDVLSSMNWGRNETEPQLRERLGLSLWHEAPGAPAAVAAPVASRSSTLET